MKLACNRALLMSYDPVIVNLDGCAPCRGCLRLIFIRLCLPGLKGMFGMKFVFKKIE